MVKIIDNARFNRNALLGDIAGSETFDLEHPGMDYVRATKIVWAAMRGESIRQDAKLEKWSKEDAHKGRILTGMGPAQVIDLLWPNLSDNEAKRSRSRMTIYLRESGNARCLIQGRRANLAEWWISDEWADIKVRASGARAQQFSNKAKKRKPAPELATNLAGALLAQEAAASVALDKGEGQTHSFGPGEAEELLEGERKYVSPLDSEKREEWSKGHAGLYQHWNDSEDKARIRAFLNATSPMERVTHALDVIAEEFKHVLEENTALRTEGERLAAFAEKYNEIKKLLG